MDAPCHCLTPCFHSLSALDQPTSPQQKPKHIGSVLADLRQRHSDKRSDRGKSLERTKTFAPSRFGPRRSHTHPPTHTHTHTPAPSGNGVRAKCTKCDRGRPRGIASPGSERCVAMCYVAVSLCSRVPCVQSNWMCLPGPLLRLDNKHPHCCERCFVPAPCVRLYAAHLMRPQGYAGAGHSRRLSGITNITCLSGLEDAIATPGVRQPLSRTYPVSMHLRQSLYIHYHVDGYIAEKMIRVCLSVCLSLCLSVARALSTPGHVSTVLVGQGGPKRRLTGRGGRAEW